MRMLPLMLLSPAVLLGCAGPSDDEGDTDGGDTGSSDTGTDTDGGAVDEVCTGVLALTFDDMPDRIEASGETWTHQGITFRAEDFRGRGTDLIRGMDGCMELGPGAIQGRLYEYGCAATQARFTVQSQCGQGGRGCTEVLVGTPTGGALAQSSALTDQEATLTVSEPSGFSIVAMGSLQARLCRIEVDLAPLTEDLEPEDTGAPF